MRACTETRPLFTIATLAALAAGCGGIEQELVFEDDEVSTSTQELYVKASTIWTQLKIPVCWEPTDIYYRPLPAYTTEKGWVRQAIEETWELYSHVDFTGWGTCKPGAYGIHITILDYNSQVLALGHGLNAFAHGMYLNFTFDRWMKHCKASTGKRRWCVRVTAIHEFGHALGFSHEHNRDDTPATCTAAPQGTDGDTKVGPWDATSVMNYCTPSRDTLSAGDIEGLRQYYGSPAYASYPKDAVDWGNGKVHFFNYGKYTRFDLQKNRTDHGWPKAIKTMWGWPAHWNYVRAAINWGNGKIYLFRGSEYLRYDIGKGRIDPGYPKQIHGAWGSWPTSWSSPDAAVNWGNGKAYFFKGSEYLRYDVAKHTVDPGYPKPIAPYWPWLWPSGLEYIVTRSDKPDKAFFFKGKEFIQFDRKRWRVDAGPELIVGRWPGVPF